MILWTWTPHGSKQFGHIDLDPGRPLRKRLQKGGTTGIQKARDPMRGGTGQEIRINSRWRRGRHRASKDDHGDGFASEHLIKRTLKTLPVSGRQGWPLLHQFGKVMHIVRQQGLAQADRRTGFHQALRQPLLRHKPFQGAPRIAAGKAEEHRQVAKRLKHTGAVDRLAARRHRHASDPAHPADIQRRQFECSLQGGKQAHT